MANPSSAPPLVFEDWLRDVIFLLGQIERDCADQVFRNYACIYLVHYRELVAEGKVPASDTVTGVLRYFERPSMVTA